MIYVLTPAAVLVYSGILYVFVGRRSNENLFLYFLCLAMGIGSAALAFGLEYGWHLLTQNFIRSHPGFIILESFAGVALIEETAKWFWLPLVIRHWSGFRKYTDGILFASCIAAGFNLVEGSLYAFTEYDMTNMAIRGFTAVPAHFLFAIIMGFLFSRFRFEGGSFLWHSLWIPVVIHGVYDFFIFQTFSEMLLGGALLVLFACLVLAVWICRMALRVDLKNA